MASSKLRIFLYNLRNFDKTLYLSLRGQNNRIMATVKITLTNFDKEILNAKKPAILDFWATWCGPCQWMSPVFDELSDEYGKKMIFGKVNVDEETLLSQKFGIRGIPCMILFKNGEEADRIVGFVPKEELEAKLKGFLA